MGMYWHCPACDTVSSHDDFGPEDDELCRVCGWPLRQKREEV
jgi:rubredoxin